jgi:hypothetical protein
LKLLLPVLSFNSLGKDPGPIFHLLGRHILWSDEAASIRKDRIDALFAAGGNVGQAPFEPLIRRHPDCPHRPAETCGSTGEAGETALSTCPPMTAIVTSPDPAKLITLGLATLIPVAARAANAKAAWFGPANPETPIETDEGSLCSLAMKSLPVLIDDSLKTPSAISSPRRRSSTGRNRQHISRHMTDGQTDLASMIYDSEDAECRGGAVGRNRPVHSSLGHRGNRPQGLCGQDRAERR